jgi:uncharacterized surface protein with fasciclin (FAS1) repeats
MSPTRLLLAASAAALISMGAASAQTSAPAAALATSAAKPVAAQGDLVDTLKLSGQFTTFVGGIDATNLTSLLKTNTNLTVFAPTDAAFAAMPAADLARLKSDKAAMQRFVLHHVVNAPVPASKIKGAKGEWPSGAGDKILLDGSDENALKADGATILQSELKTASGTLYVVDRVLVAGQGAVEPTAAAAPSADASATAAAKPSAASGTNGAPKP